MTRTNILFVSIAFPPKFDSESLQTERIFREILKREGYQMGVVTAQSADILNLPTMDGMADFSGEVDDYIELSVRENRWRNRALSLVGLSQFPDTKRAFHKASLSAFSALKHRPDVIYSRAFPPSSSILACRLSKHFGVPWVMHLSDPWALSPIHHYSPIERVYNHRWERFCVEQASFVSFTTKRTLGLYAAHYQDFSEKFFIASNSVELGDVSLRQDIAIRSDDGMLNIVHTGLLNKYRSPALVIEALRTIQRDRPDISSMLQVNFAGPCDRHVACLFTENSDLVSYVGTVPYDKSRQMIKGADLVISIDNDFADDASAVFLPSKLLDYGAARKKVVCITNRNSPSEAFVEKTNGVVFQHDANQPLVEFLVAAAGARTAGDTSAFDARPLPGSFTTSFVVDRILEKVDDALLEIS